MYSVDFEQIKKLQHIDTTAIHEQKAVVLAIE
jgi:hypothetical protein